MARLVLLYQLTLELLLYQIHDNVDFTLFYCVRLKLDSRFNWGINTMAATDGGLGKLFLSSSPSAPTVQHFFQVLSRVAVGIN